MAMMMHNDEGNMMNDEWDVMTSETDGWRIMNDKRWKIIQIFKKMIVMLMKIKKNNRMIK